MQAGVTGINLLEYITQSNNQKKKILMVLLLKKWLPELSNFDVPFIHEPWKLTAFDLIDKTIPLFYKNPIISVDLKRTKTVKQLWSLKSNQIVKQESKRLLKVHVRPKNNN